MIIIHGLLSPFERSAQIKATLLFLRASVKNGIKGKDLKKFKSFYEQLLASAVESVKDLSKETLQKIITSLKEIEEENDHSEMGNRFITIYINALTLKIEKVSPPALVTYPLSFRIALKTGKEIDILIIPTSTDPEAYTETKQASSSSLDTKLS